MKKRYKTDYFEKMNQLALICNDNICLALKIVSSEISSPEEKPVSGRNIMAEIKESLEKDYFAPIEREDTFILCQKLCEMSENSFLLYNESKKVNVFYLPNNFHVLCGSLQSVSKTTAEVFAQLKNIRNKVI